MKVLIIGGTGTISSAVTERCLKNNITPVLLNRGNHPAGKDIETITADINDEDAAKQALGNRTFDVVAEFNGFKPEQAERDIRLFTGKTDQYIFISSASAYQKPLIDFPITEKTPLVNPYWDYSRNKAACEDVLFKAYRENGFPVTVVRPSHTFNEKKVPVSLHGKNGSYQVVKRISEGRKVIIPGDGTTRWTLTFSTDFAKGFTGLFGKKEALGEAYHITSDESMTWNVIYETIAEALGKKLSPVHISTDFLIACGRKSGYDFAGNLLGDKAASVSFDNTKIKAICPEFVCTVSMKEGITRAVEYVMSHKERQTEDPEFDSWCDRIIGLTEEAERKFTG